MSTRGRARPWAGSSNRGGHLVEHFAWMADNARDRARRGDRGVGEIDLRLRMTHAAGEIPVRRAEAHLSLAEHAHVATEARPTGRRRPRRACREEGADQAFLLGLDRNL